MGVFDWPIFLFYAPNPPTFARQTVRLASTHLVQAVVGGASGEDHEVKQQESPNLCNVVIMQALDM